MNQISRVQAFTRVTARANTRFGMTSPSSDGLDDIRTMLYQVGFNLIHPSTQPYRQNDVSLYSFEP